MFLDGKLPGPSKQRGKPSVVDGYSYFLAVGLLFNLPLKIDKRQKSAFCHLVGILSFAPLHNTGYPTALAGILETRTGKNGIVAGRLRTLKVI